MIYLRESNLIFIKPRKVAGTSFEIALSEYAMEGNIVTPIRPNDEVNRRALGFRGAQNYLKPRHEYSAGDLYRFLMGREGTKKYFNHISAKQLRDKLGAGVFDKAKKISIVRNPYDRLVSMYYWTIEEKAAKGDMAFAEWLRYNPEYVRQNYEHYFIDRKFVVDHVIRYENLLEDCFALEGEFSSLEGLSYSMKKIKAKGGIRPKERSLADYYHEAADLVSIVEFFNRELIDMFGYETP